MSDTEQPIPRDVAEKALDVWAPMWWRKSSDAVQSHLIDSMQCVIDAVRPLLLVEADREIAALKAEIARLRKGHRESANQFAMLADEHMKKAMKHDPASANYISYVDKAATILLYAVRCKALAEGRES